jgi:hypothetical protein
VSPSDAREAVGLSPSDFLLPPEKFVVRCAELIGLPEREFNQDDASRLVAALRNGVSRLQVADVMMRRKAPHLTIPGSTPPTALLREPDCFAVVDLFVQYAPEDDAAFLNYAFRRICEREPTPRERLEFEFDLRRRVITRIEVIKRIVQTRRDEGYEAAWDVLFDKPGEVGEEAGPARALLSFSGEMRDEAGREHLVVVRHAPGVGWLFAQNLWRQPYNPLADASGWKLHPGWVLTGPKRTLPSGEWRMNLDLIQPVDGRLDVEICANSGLDRILSLTLEGPCAGAMRFRLMPWHLFVEVRIFKPEQDPELCWMHLRDLSLVRTSSGI